MCKTSVPFSEKSLEAIRRWRNIRIFTILNSGITEELLTDLIAACTTLTQLYTTDYTDYESNLFENFIHGVTVGCVTYALWSRHHINPTTRLMSLFANIMSAQQLLNDKIRCAVEYADASCAQIYCD